MHAEVSLSLGALLLGHLSLREMQTCHMKAEVPYQGFLGKKFL
jgi:hypothetical protein